MARLPPTDDKRATVSVNIFFIRNSLFQLSFAKLKSLHRGRKGKRFFISFYNAKIQKICNCYKCQLKKCKIIQCVYNRAIVSVHTIPL